MRNAIFKRLLIVAGVTLLVFGIILYILLGRRLLTNTKEQMLSAIHIMDYALEYEENLPKQLISLQETGYNKECRLTVIDFCGNVLADTQVTQTEQLENHLEREEVQAAIESGEGYAIRYSDTIKERLLYVAAASEKGDYILRLAVPYSGSREYADVLLPTFFLGALVALAVSAFLADRLAKSIAKPLSQIADELYAVNGETHSLKKYRYPELDIISESIRRSNERNDNYLRRLEQEKKIRQEFFSNASHELKTPITSIRGYAELLNAGFVQEEETKKDFLSRIMKETDHMTGLINDILMISKLEAGETEVVLATVRFAPLVEEVIKAFLPAAGEQGVTLTWECEPVAMQASEQQLRELLSNLVGNGIKYNVPGGSVTVTVAAESGGIRIQVADTGIGMEQEELGRIFERFYRVDKGRSKRVSGTGLGLSIVKHITEFYGGTIEVTSEPRKGSTFTVHLPGNTAD